MRAFLIIFCILSSAGSGLAASLSLVNVQAAPTPIGANLIPNPGFETADENGVPAGWLWDRRNTDSTCTLDGAAAHTGSHSLRLTNKSPFGAQIYGTLWTKTPVPVEKGKTYTLSAWTRSEDPGMAWIGGGSDWQFRLTLPPTGGVWKRVQMQFTPGDGETNFLPRINTDSATAGVWIDDLKLEEGATATPAIEPGETATQLYAETPDLEISGDGPFELAFTAFTPGPLVSLIDVSLDGVAGPLRQTISLPAGASRLVVKGEASGVDTAPHLLHVRLISGGREAAAAQSTVRFLSTLGLQNRLNALKAKLPAFRDSIGRLKGQDPSYPLVSLTVLENFAGYVQQDLDFHAGADCPFLKRATQQLDDLEAMAVRLEVELETHRKFGRPFPSVPRWTGTVRPRVSGPSLLAPTVTGVTEPAGKPSKVSWRPVFFTGYGHFGQVRNDLEKFASYGTNIIQIEVGPNSVLPAPGIVSQAPMQDLAALLDRAERARVAVCLLISPHYFPEWMLQAEPKLRKKRQGFLQYCIHAPEGQELLRRYITALLLPLKDKPALQSICLTNEPTNLEEPCEDGARLWHEWLEKRHGTLAELNNRWGSHYARFDDIPLPNPFKPLPASPIWMDFIRFNQAFFASWHGMLADAVRRAAPGIPVHAKPMSWTFFGDSAVLQGVDATLFGRMSDINGNDSGDFASYGPSEFAQSWLQNAMAYDLQRSVKDAPVFNSENHLIPDREVRTVPPAHIRAALWQGAVHGESATTIWVWERSMDPNSDTAGSIMHRPACAEAVGRVNLDLNRASPEMTALQAAPAQVFILQSPTAAVWDGGRYSDCTDKLYGALAFTGLKIGFITEPQLESGVLPGAGALFVPNMIHLSRSAFATLGRWRGPIIYTGGPDLLSRDEYDHPLTSRLPAEILPFTYTQTTWRQIWNSVQDRLAPWHLSPTVAVRDSAGQPVWGVEWRSVHTPHGLLVNFCNERTDAVQVTPVENGHGLRLMDVLTGEKMPRTFTLQPLEGRIGGGAIMSGGTGEWESGRMAEWEGEAPAEPVS